MHLEMLTTMTICPMGTTQLKTSCRLQDYLSQAEALISLRMRSRYLLLSLALSDRSPHSVLAWPLFLLQKQLWRSVSLAVSMFPAPAEAVFLSVLAGRLGVSAFRLGGAESAPVAVVASASQAANLGITRRATK